CDVVLPISSVSRRHFHVLCEGSEYFIEDLGSRGGTWVNNQAQANGKTKLRPGDKIRVCDFVAVFEFPFAPELLRWNAELIPRIVLGALTHSDDVGAWDAAELLVLADALTDAGADERFIDHLREPGPHRRDCWAVKAILNALRDRPGQEAVP